RMRARRQPGATGNKYRDVQFHDPDSSPRRDRPAPRASLAPRTGHPVAEWGTRSAPAIERSFGRTNLRGCHRQRKVERPCRNDQTGQRRRGGEEESESYAGCGTTSGGCRKVFTDSGRAPRRLDTQIVSTMGLPCRQELLCERFDQIDLIDLAVEPDTVDEEGGRAVHGTGGSTPQVVAVPRDMGPRRKFARHLLERQREMLREVGEQRIPQSLLVL